MSSEEKHDGPFGDPQSFSKAVFSHLFMWVGANLGAKNEWSIETMQLFIKCIRQRGDVAPLEFAMSVEAALRAHYARGSVLPQADHKQWAAAGSVQLVGVDGVEAHEALMRTAAFALSKLDSTFVFAMVARDRPTFFRASLLGSAQLMFRTEVADGEAYVKEADVRLVLSYLNIQAPAAPASDFAAWSPALRDMGLALTRGPQAGVALARFSAARTDNDWAALATQLRSDGTLPDDPAARQTQRPDATASVSLAQANAELFSGLDSTSIKGALDLLWDSLPNGNKFTTSLAKAASVKQRRKEVARVAAAMASALGWPPENLVPDQAEADDDGMSAEDQFIAKVVDLIRADDERGSRPLRAVVPAAAAGAVAAPAPATSDAARSMVMDAVQGAVSGAPMVGLDSGGGSGRPTVVYLGGNSDDSKPDLDKYGTDQQLSATKVGPSLVQVAESVAQKRPVEVVEAVHTLDAEVYKLMAKTVSDQKASSDAAASATRTLKRVAASHAVSYVRASSRPHATAPGLELPQSAVTDIFKGEFIKSGPHVVSHPHTYTSFHLFCKSLTTAQSEYFVPTLKRWAHMVDGLIAVRATLAVNRYLAICAERCDEGVVFAWSTQQRADFLTWIIYTFSFVYKEWLKSAVGAPRPLMDAFESWPNYAEMLTNVVPSWGREHGVRPQFLGAVLTTAAPAKAPAAAPAPSPAPSPAPAPAAQAAAGDGAAAVEKLVASQKRLADMVKNLQSTVGAAAAAGGGGSPPAPKKLKKLTGKQGDGAAAVTTGVGKMAAQSVPTGVRSEKPVVALFGEPDAKKALDKHPNLHRDRKTAVCRSWLVCRFCSQSVSADNICRWGSHYVSEAVTGQVEDAEGLVRDLAAAEGRDVSAWGGISSVDKHP